MPMGGPGGPGGMGRGPMGGPRRPGGMGRGHMPPPPPRPPMGGIGGIGGFGRMFAGSFMPRYNRGCCSCLGCGIPIILGLGGIIAAVIFAVSCLI